MSYPNICQPNCYRLPEKNVHIWKAALELPLKHVLDLMPLLSPDEIDRANGFYFERHKRRYVVCRGLLRVLLGGYLGVDPQQIRFAYRKNGKPVLNPGNHNENLFFNVSHSKVLALFAFAYSPWVGIDVEYIQYHSSTEELARNFYHKRENDFLATLPIGLKKKVFYNLWTCKEAYLKAIGEGLAGIEKVEILRRKNKQIIIHYANGRFKLLNDWLLKQFKPEQDYAAALVLKGRHWNIKYHNITIASPMLNRWSMDTNCNH